MLYQDRLYNILIRVINVSIRRLIKCWSRIKWVCFKEFNYIIDTCFSVTKSLVSKTKGTKNELERSVTKNKS